MAKKWRLSYLPLFYEDLNSTITYISDVLENPQAASELLDETEAAIKKRLPEADKYHVYNSPRKRPDPYYMIPVKNFMVFYVVIETDTEKIMEIRRFLYKRRNIGKLI